MRGIAAIVVVVWHESIFFGFRPGSGYLAVDLFFCLSGFVLSHAYGRKLETRSISRTHFMALRLVRLYPLYILSLVVMILSLLLTIALHLPTNWNLKQIGESLPFSVLFLPTPPLHSQSVFPLNNPAWSLFYELVVNVFYALIAATLTVGRLRFFIGISALLVAVSVAVEGSLDLGGTWPTLLIGVPRVFYAFLVGLQIHRAKLPFRLSPIVVLALTAVMLWLDPGGYRAYYDAVCVLILVPALVIAGSNSEPPRFLMSTCWLLGSTSYALYVLHVPSTAGLRGVLQRLVGSIFAPWSGFFIVIGLLSLCVLLDRYFDVPIRKSLVARLRRPTTA
jgi:peptidoglycan/LPS O-acetylase OafA/YrhL